MFNSLKKQNRMRSLTQRRTINCTPVHSGRGETSIAASEESELNALNNAMRRGQPFYFIRTGDGVTLDVLLDKTIALKTRDNMRERVHNGRPNIQAFERIGTYLNLL
jgi:hypothetical protein